MGHLTLNARMFTHNVLSQDEEFRVLTEIDNLECEIICDLFHPQIKEFLYNKLTECLDKENKCDLTSFEGIGKFLRFTDPGRKLFLKIIKSIEQNDEFIPKFRSKKTWSVKILKKHSLLVLKRNDFAAKNLRLVAKLSKFSYGMKLNLSDDLIQEGGIGLMKAIERFDVKKGFRFSTYANWWIKHHIRRYISDKGETIRIPVHMSDHIYKINSIEKNFQTKNGRTPTDEELSEISGLNLSKTKSIREIKNKPSMGSLDAPIGNERENQSIVDFIADNKENAYEVKEKQDLKEALEKAIGDLKPFESYIIRNRYGFGTKDEMTLQEIGEIRSLSRERIRQIEFIAKQKLRKDPQLREFL
jgi:RNA polymerase sigma factor (sigma-70 family)